MAGSYSARVLMKLPFEVCELSVLICWGEKMNAIRNKADSHVGRREVNRTRQNIRIIVKGKM